jgi:hypothetical protein
VDDVVVRVVDNVVDDNKVVDGLVNEVDVEGVVVRRMELAVDNDVSSGT